MERRLVSRKTSVVNQAVVGGKRKRHEDEKKKET